MTTKRDYKFCFSGKIFETRLIKGGPKRRVLAAMSFVAAIFIASSVLIIDKACADEGKPDESKGSYGEGDEQMALNFAPSEIESRIFIQLLSPVAGKAEGK